MQGRAGQKPLLEACAAQTQGSPHIWTEHLLRVNDCDDRKGSGAGLPTCRALGTGHATGKKLQRAGTCTGVGALLEGSQVTFEWLPKRSGDYKDRSV